MVLKCRRVVRPSRARRKTDALRLVPRRRSHDPLILRNGGGPKQKPNNNNNNNRPNGALGFPLKWPTRLPKLKIKKNGKKIKNSIGRRFFFHTIRWTLSTGYSDNEWLVILDSPFNEQQLPSNFCRLIYRSEGKPEGETLKPNLDFFFKRDEDVRPSRLLGDQGQTWGQTWGWTWGHCRLGGGLTFC